MAHDNIGTKLILIKTNYFFHQQKTGKNRLHLGTEQKHKTGNGIGKIRSSRGSVQAGTMGS